MKEAKYMVRFDLLTEDGEWKPDYISNYDKGFTRDEADYIVKDMAKRGKHRNARMIAMREGSYDYER